MRIWAASLWSRSKYLESIVVIENNRRNLFATTFSISCRKRRLPRCSNGGKTGAERATGGLGSFRRACDRIARTGRIDLAWTNVSDLAANARILWCEPLVAVVAPEYPLAQTSGPISVRDLGAHPFVHRSSCELDAVGRAQLKAGCDVACDRACQRKNLLSG